MALTDVALRKQSLPKAKPYKVADKDGLFLLVTPAGGKYWRMKYRYAGKEKLLSFGVYPEVGLAKARERCRDARELLAERRDPSEAKKEQKRQVFINTANSFEALAREWHATKCSTLEPRYAGFIMKRLEKDIFPKLGSRPVRDITPPELLFVLREIEKRGALEVAHRAMKACGQIVNAPQVLCHQIFTHLTQVSH